MRYFNLYVDKTNSFFTYCDKFDEFKIGDRVAVNFRNRECGAFIISESKEKEFEFKVLPIKRKLEQEVSLDKSYIDMLLWVSKYYLSKFPQVLKAAIPSDLKIKYSETYSLTDMGRRGNILNPIVQYLLEREGVTKATLRKNFSNDFIKKMINEKILYEDMNKKISYNYENRDMDKTEISNLENDEEDDFEKRIIEIEDREKLKKYFVKKSMIGKQSLESKFSKKDIDKLIKDGSLEFIRKIQEKENLEENVKKVKQEVFKNNSLNEEQEKVKESIKNSDKHLFLIRGITGSGKTEVYINLIREALVEGKGSIFLVPEISLTPQMVERFKQEFKDGVAILHSKLTNKERGEEWLQIYSGAKKIVLGVRSAIFAPVKNLKYIIIDEEHEASYKQDSSPIYNAKYIAVRRAQLENLKIILGSATPSIESYYYGRKGDFQLLTMDKRYNDAKLPDVEIVDMKDEEDHFFSKELLKNIRDTLLKKEQVILLLNRKGYSTMVQCKDCGHIEECDHCSIKMSYYHSKRTLKCNYCGIEKKFDGKCSKCGSKNLDFGGKGVEQVEEKLRNYFNVPIVRMDAEAAKEKNFYKKTYYDFLNKKYDIMIGTQLIAKGFHFPDVTLVGIINADMILSFPDFRAGEKTYQLITQAAGRAGRGEKQGKVIIQTYQPENYVIKKIQKQDYDEFYESEIELRELVEYPPFSKIINIGLSSRDERKLDRVSRKLFDEIKRDYIEIYGPNQSLVYRVKDRYRKNIFIKGNKKNINYYKKELRKILNGFDDEGVRIVIDVDPLNLV